MDFNDALGPIWQQLATIENLIVMLATGALMELFKKAPLTREFASSRVGEALQYYAPFLWCWTVLIVPGLSPEDTPFMHKILLGIVLASLSTSVYECTVKVLRKVRVLTEAEDHESNG